MHRISNPASLGSTPSRCTIWEVVIIGSRAVLKTAGPSGLQSSSLWLPAICVYGGMADTRDLKSLGESRASSNLATRTICGGRIAAIAADCKSAISGFRWFESIPPHHLTSWVRGLNQLFAKQPTRNGPQVRILHSSPEQFTSK